MFSNENADSRLKTDISGIAGQRVWWCGSVSGPWQDVPQCAVTFGQVLTYRSFRTDPM